MTCDTIDVKAEKPFLQYGLQGRVFCLSQEYIRLFFKPDHIHMAVTPPKQHLGGPAFFDAG